MPDYKNGKIYMLESKEGNVRYYGSTVQSLKERLRKHKVDKKRYEEVKNRYYTSYKILEYSDCEISLVEDYPCNNKKELETRERFYIENNDCVNKFIPTRTLKEWREEKKDEIKQQNKEYYEKNKDEILQKQKEYREEKKDEIKQQNKERYEKNKDEIKQKQKEKITCVCGAVVRKNDIRRHERSKKHQEYIKTI
jgi:hypothetical protein